MAILKGELTWSAGTGVQNRPPTCKKKPVLKAPKDFFDLKIGKVWWEGGGWMVGGKPPTTH